MNTERGMAHTQVELIKRHDGQLDETFALFVRVMYKRKGGALQEWARRLGISPEYVRYLRCGLVHRVDVPEYLLHLIEKEAGWSYNEFVHFLCSQSEQDHLKHKTGESVPAPQVDVENMPIAGVIRASADRSEVEAIQPSVMDACHELHRKGLHFNESPEKYVIGEQRRWNMSNK